VEVAAQRELKWETAFAILRLVVGLALLVGFVSILGWRYRDELTHFGEWFVDRFGVVGMIVGTALADGIHFPLPPQFYLLTGIAGGYGGYVTFFAVLLGSEIGSFLAYSIGGIASKTKLVERFVSKPRAMLERVIDRQGYVGLGIATFLPISWCILCATIGAMHFPSSKAKRALCVLFLMRVPKVLLSYVVIVYAWR
jgi:membrane protein YqaA with SNARE-associated domain